MNGNKKKKDIPVWERVMITMDEASAYTGIGDEKLRRICKRPNCEFVAWKDNRRMINREKLEEFLEKSHRIL